MPSQPAQHSADSSMRPSQSLSRPSQSSGAPGTLPPKGGRTSVRVSSQSHRVRSSPSRHASTGLKDLKRPMPRYWFDSRRHYFLKNHGKAYTWAANTAQAVGLATFKVRAKIQQKDDPDPARFLRDFVRYNFLDERP